MTTADPSNDRLLLKVSQVAEILSISRSKVYELIGRGELRTVHIGRSVFVRPEECERFVRALQASQ